MCGLRPIVLRYVPAAFVAAASIGFLASQGPGQDLKPEMSGAEKLVQEQVEAYNRHDVESFLKTYAPEITLYAFPDRELRKGLDSMRTTYSKLFADHPELKVKIAKRIVQGEYVIDHEQVMMKDRETTAVAIYRVQGGKITEVRFLK
jgi:hypothetical protein